MKCLANALVLLGLFPAIGTADDASFDSLSMDRHTPTSTVTVDVGYVVIDPTQPPPPFPESKLRAIGMTVGGHYVDTHSGFGAYVAIPLSYLDVQLPLINPDSELSIGNLELGAMLARQLAPSTMLVAHAGIAFPTADDDGVGGLFQPIASSPRYGDLVQRTPNSTWFRMGVSPMGRSGQLLWRVDAGLDLVISDDNNGGAISPVFHLGVGGGVDLHSVQLLAELVTDFIDSDGGDDSASTLALGARIGGGSIAPGVALLLPLGFDDPNGDLKFAIALSLAGRI